MIITIKDGLVWEVINGKEPRMLNAPEADRIAAKNGFVYAERLVKHYVGQTVALDSELNIHGRSSELMEAMDQAREALIGDSNDAEHDALVSLMGALGETIPERE
jgi:hypothetical protein